MTALAGATVALALTGCEGNGKCVSNAEYFRKEVWAPTLSVKCVKCHNISGAAKDTKFILEESSNPGYIEANLKVIGDLARYEVDGEKLLLIKPTMRGVDHGGGLQLEAKSDEYEALAEMIRRIDDPVECDNSVDLAEYFAGVELLDEEATLRKASLALLGRLPTQDEYEQVRGLGIDSLDVVLDEMMTQDEFYDRLGEIYNDLFLTDRYYPNTNAIDLLYDYDYPNRRWFDATPDESLASQQAGRANRAVSRAAINLVKHVVRNDKPFTEILTADYMIFNPYSAKSYGALGLDGGPLVFADDTDQDELLAGRLPARGGLDVFPHAGVISDPMWMIRFPTTETNRNRHRARMIYRFFLATDVLRLAERPIDPTAITDFNPTLNNENCAACHGRIDPMAGTLMNFNTSGQYEPPKDGWFPDMRIPGFKDETVAFEDFPTAHQWLAAQIAKDDLFAVSTVHTLFTGITGQDVMLEPSDAADPEYVQKHKAFEIQDEVLKDIAQIFIDNEHDFKMVVKEIVKTSYFRARNSGELSAERASELSTVGTAEFLPPELLARKIEAVTGYPWRANPKDQDYLLNMNEYRIFYGGIDSDSIIERIREPNGIMANIAARMSNEMACWTTARDFSQEPPDRLLFPYVETNYNPEDDNGNAVPAVIDAIKANIQYLHNHVLGEQLTLDDPQIDRTYELFIDIWKDGKTGVTAGTYDGNLPGNCRSENDWWTGNPLPEERRISADPDYTVRAWMGVMTYLLSDYRFLHE